MIQRIQSIFLAIASACSFALLSFPFATTKQSVAQSTLFSNDAAYNLQDNVLLLVCYLLAGGVALATIFLFKNRPLQMKLGRGAAVINLAGILLAVVLFMQDGANLDKVDVSDGVGLYLPIVGFVLLLLAVRFIQKDEKKVRSMDRLR